MSTPISQVPAAPRHDEPRTAFVLSGGGNQGVSQVGMLRALLERDIVPDVVIGTSAGALNGAAIAATPNLTGRRTPRRDVGVGCAASDVFPGGRLSPGLEPPHAATTTSSATRASRELIARSHAPRGLRRPPRSRSGWSPPTSTPARRSCSARPAQAGAAREHRAARASSRRSATTAGVLVDGAVVDTVPLSHALAGPVDRGLRAQRRRRPRRTGRSARPLDVAIRAFAHQRASQRFELELRSVPGDVEVVVLPAPPDDRDLFDFSGARELIDEAHELADSPRSTSADVAAHQADDAAPPAGGAATPG